MDTNSVTIMPMSQEISLTPGETYTGNITIANPADAASNMPYTLSVAPYGVIGSSYNINLSTRTSRTEIVDWITIEGDTSGTLAPNETKQINFTIKVPKSAAPGGQYATIKIINENADSNTSDLLIGNVYEVASIIYGNVAGDIVREGSVTSQSAPDFITSPEFVISSTITNSGTTHEDALYSFKITNTFNGDVIYPRSSNSSDINEIIMPDTTRDLIHEFKDLPALGVINVKETIEYNGETYVLDKNIIICPVWFTVLLGATLISAIALIVAKVKKSHRKKRRSTI